MNLTAIVIGLFAVVYAALVGLAIRRPLLARLALREAVRRPGQSAVVVLGLMVGTTAIFATQVLGDSFLESSTRGAFLAWGRVDLVATDGGRFFDPRLAAGLAADPQLKASLVRVQPGVELTSSVADLDRRLAKGLVTLVGFDPGTQGAFGSYRLRGGRTTTGLDLLPGEVLTSASLADAVDARPGDRLRVSVGQQQVVELRLAGVAEPEGPGAYTLRPALFAPLTSLRPLIGDQGINVIRVAIPGEGRAELDGAHRVTPQVRAALQGLPGGRNLRVAEAKREAVDAMVTRAHEDAAFITGLSFFVALAGSALVVNLGLALAEERRPRHAVLRALGLSRTGVITLTVLEGALYSLAGAAAALVPGAIVGFLLARMMQGGNALYSFAVERSTGPVLYSISLASVALSMAIGALIVMATLFLTSLRSSRMEISAAIKNLPEPVPRTRSSIGRTALLAALGLASLAALIAGSLPIRLGGGVGVVITAAALVGGRISDRLRTSITGAALAAWAAACVGSIRSEVVVLGLSALVAVFGLSLIVAANLRLLEIPAGRFRGGARATLRPSLAYLTRRPVRAGLGTGAFALILALMTMASVMVPSWWDARGLGLDEYDIRVSAPTTAGLSLPDAVRPQVVREIALPTRSYRGEVRSGAGYLQRDLYLPLHTLSRTQLASQPFQLSLRDGRFKTDAEVWRAVADDPHLVVTPIFYPSDLAITLVGPNGPVQFRVAATMKTLGLYGLAGSEAAMARIGWLPVGTTILAKAVPGADAGSVARRIERGVFAQGADTTTVREMSDSDAVGLHAETDVTSLVMGTGLLVGVLSLGIVALRAVIERRRSIGLLRALGYRSGQLLAGILSEGLITATSGALVGIGVGLVMSRLMLNVFVPQARLEINVSYLALVVGLIYVSALAVTIPPALRAARLPAVEALRVEA